MTNKVVVFTPLRILLISTIVVFNLLAIFTLIYTKAAWAEFLGIFSVVFIMLFVFVILLEWTWLHHRGKKAESVALKSQYRTVKLIYGILFVLGFVISYAVLA